MSKKKSKLKLVPIGGLQEVGKNMTAYEYDNEIILIDCGMTFPDDEMLGIDVVIPDYTYLIENKKKIRGIILTHGHEDHLGGIPYFLREVNVPIYGTRLTIGLLDRKLTEFRDIKNVRTQVIKPGDHMQIGKFQFEFIRVSHSIPDAVSVAIHTPVGTVIHTGDFKIDYTPIDGQMIELGKFAELGNRGVLALFADSTNVERPGFTMSESTVGETFENIFRHTEARIFVASFASNVHRVQQVMNAALANNRKVAFSGRSMLNVTGVATELGYLKFPRDLVIDVNDIDKYPDNEIVVVLTGSQGEPMAALSRMTRAEHRQLDLRPGDLVILSASAIPGNEKPVKQNIDRLMAAGAEVIYESLADVHVSGHACQEELKIIHALVKPKYFIPGHGEYSMLKHHAKLAENMGMDPDNIFILNNGDVLEFDENRAQIAGSVPSGITMVDGLGVGDVGNIVLRDRKHLSEDGLMIVVFAMDKKGRLSSGPDIISRGFVYVRESEDLMEGARAVVDKAIKDSLAKNNKEWSQLKHVTKRALSDYLYKKTRRNPMILPIVMQV